MAKHRPKPLHGAKKWDRAILTCTTKDCDNEFYVSRATTPAKRYCVDHFKTPVQSAANINKQKTVDLLTSLRLIPLSN